MRPFGVVFAPQRIAVALLLCTRALDGRDGLSLHGAMQKFVRAIRLRLSRMNALMLNAESHPPHMQVRQPVNGLRRVLYSTVNRRRPDRTVIPLSTTRLLVNSTSVRPPAPPTKLTN